MAKQTPKEAVCAVCGTRPAVSGSTVAFGGSVKRKRRSPRVRKHHDVCRQCWRSMRDALRASIENPSPPERFHPEERQEA